jgi:tartrate dehydrogenase/decarboxylase/D-malate dehydrogenase
MVMAETIREKVHRIAVIPGDGIGPDVIAAGIDALQTVAARNSFRLELTEYPWSCEWYTEHGTMMPDDALDLLGESDAIYLGAVGFPGVPDHISLWGLLLPIRQAFDQYVNLRPIRALEGVPFPLSKRDNRDLDIMLVRENTEGEYAGVGGRIRQGTPDEVALQTSVFTRRGVERIVRYGFEQAEARSGRLASATKSNALQHTAVFWDEVVDEVAVDYPEVEVTSYLIDALAARFISAPESLDVVVGSNLFGDVLADIGAALMGSMGLAASANLNPAGTLPSLFEPVHGSAPDIAGQGKANPIASVWSAAMMLDHLGEAPAASQLMAAIEAVARDGVLTPDLGGKATTVEVSAAIVEAASPA